MSHWAPKPLRPTLNEGIFKFVEKETVVKGKSPIQVQREADGSPYTTPAVTGLGPAQPKLTLKPEEIVSKSSLAAKIKPKTDAESLVDTETDSGERINKATQAVASLLVSKGLKLPISF